MRTLQTVVVVQAIALVVLFAIWTQRAPTAAPPMSGTGSAGDTRLENAARTAGGEGGAAGADAMPIERERAPRPASGGSALRVVLQGRFTGCETPPDPDTVRLSLRQQDTWRGGDATAHGGYAVAGLTPGTWRVRCEVPGYRALDFEHALDDTPVQRLDLPLEPATVLTVWARTPDGKRLATELTKMNIWQGLRVIASPEPLAGDFAPTENSSIGDIGIARFRQPSDLNQRTDPDAADGTLELDQEPPATAALMLRHMVLAQQPIEPDQTELRFVVDIAAVQARFPRVSMRLLGPDGPVTKAHVSLSTAQGGGGGLAPDEDGKVVIPNALPGLASFEIWAQGLERYNSHLTIPSDGTAVDLGDVLLTAASELHGRAVDATANPVKVSVQWTAIDLWRPPHPLIDRRSTSSDGDGKFQLHGTGRRRYTVRANTSDGRAGFAFVDGATAGAEPFVVTVRPTHKLHLDAGDAGLRCVAIADAQGRPLAVRRIEPRWPQQTMQLPDGDYRMLVYDGHGAELSRESLVVAGTDIRRVLP
ncbi:MAG: hypothetical protein KAI24_16295 [Planctomycetes bacterium]|nr:hypothetical protein [Planctomycetota bacterium]